MFRSNLKQILIFALIASVLSGCKLATFGSTTTNRSTTAPVSGTPTPDAAPVPSGTPSPGPTVSTSPIPSTTPTPTATPIPTATPVPSATPTPLPVGSSLYKFKSTWLKKNSLGSVVKYTETINSSADISLSGKFDVTKNTDSSLSVQFRKSSSAELWTINLPLARSGISSGAVTEIAPGTYEIISNGSNNYLPEFRNYLVKTSNNPCSSGEGIGTFRVYELEYNITGSITKFSADFSFLCQNSLDGKSYGHVRYNSDFPIVDSVLKNVFYNNDTGALISSTNYSALEGLIYHSRFSSAPSEESYTIYSRFGYDANLQQVSVSHIPTASFQSGASFDLITQSPTAPAFSANIYDFFGFNTWPDYQNCPATVKILEVSFLPDKTVSKLALDWKLICQMQWRTEGIYGGIRMNSEVASTTAPY